ncbi:metallophosphoesterase family protein [Chloroflexota bacterium]
MLSDTHVGSFAELPDKILTALDEVDMIIHAGDFTTKDVLDGLKQLREVGAVCGNMDSNELKQLLPEKEVLNAGGKRIEITHGWGSPWGIEDRVSKLFGDVDIIIYGHSHQPRNKVIRGILFFNPGQARHSFGILTINGEVKGEIIKMG